MIDGSALLIVVNQGDAGSKGNLATILNLGKFSDSFGWGALFENTVGPPECEHWIGSVSKLVIAEFSDATPKLLANVVVDGHK